jgi:hypothetical protein
LDEVVFDVLGLTAGERDRRQSLSSCARGLEKASSV